MRQLWKGAQSLKIPCNLSDIWGLLQKHKEALPIPRPSPPGKWVRREHAQVKLPAAQWVPTANPA